MPHIILEHSSNVIETSDFKPLFMEYHAILAEGLPANLQDFKSRVYACDRFVVSDGQAQHAFVHFTLKIKKGRSEETKNSVAAQMMERAEKFFAKSRRELKLQITIEIVELQAYFKS